ncbi:hypothetical protein SAMN06295912_13544 [Sphingomonas laterariae]|uniref:Uncharacterized protein n=1 Tax=Edaphosphingomonas laterariae TaxID=861865 RepID=A0A239JK19_9SPHN|nr:hypothetical protein [Sphingomonas laterariae]SNT06187.1 hypothetical protein SAMN06295912_13544 [Sphingomonas laterariae]
MAGNDVVVRDAILQLLRAIEAQPHMCRTDAARGFAMAAAQYYTSHRDLEDVPEYLRQQAALMTSFTQSAIATGRGRLTSPP